MSDQEKPNEYFTKIINQQNEKIMAMEKKVKGLETTQKLQDTTPQTNDQQPSTPEITLSQTFKQIYQKMKEEK